MQFNNIHFIVNPISGKGKGKLVIEKIKDLFPQEKVIIKVTGKKEDGYLFAKESINENADLIVSCGGDGTLNEVGTALVGTSIPLGVIPIGSGNGLARHLKIPLSHEEALQLILRSENTVKAIDCGKINNLYFFSNAGIGFDAEVINIYANQNQRKLIGYLKCILLGVLKYKPAQIALKAKDYVYQGKIMMLNISNSNCMGYGFSVSPKASLQDGLFDVNLVKKCSWLTFNWIGLGFLLRKKIGKKRVLFNTSELQINTQAQYIQIDGESIKSPSENINITLIPKSLNVLVG